MSTVTAPAPADHAETLDLTAEPYTAADAAWWAEHCEHVGWTPEAEPATTEPTAPAGKLARPPHNRFAFGIACEARHYERLGTPLGDFLAAQLDRLAEEARWFDATTPAEFEARKELHEDWRENDAWRDAVSTGYRLAMGGSGGR